MRWAFTIVGRCARYLGGLLAAVVLVLGSSLVVLAQGTPDKVTLPAPSGPYTVGRDSFDWTDEGREDILAPTPGIKRSLTGHIWYPAERGTEPLAPYLPVAVRNALLAQANPAVAGGANQLTVDPANVTAHSLQKPALLKGSMRFPVLLMKPGRGGLVLQYASLAEDLASHGYIVVGSDSPYTTPVVVHDDGRIVRRSPKGSPSEGAPGRTSDLAPGQPNDLSVPVVETWAADNRFLLDQLHRLDADATSRFAGRLNLDAIGAFGHSMGGAAAVQFCKDDARCRASIDIDGALWGDVAIKGTGKPTLFIFSDRPMLDRTRPENAANLLLLAIDRIRAAVPNKPSLVIVRGSQHYNFADSALLSELNSARLMGMIGSIDPVRALAVTRQQARDFFDDQLRNSPAAETRGEREIHVE